jgi:hypothetical protein
MKGRWDFGEQRAGAARDEAAINASQKRSAASSTSRKIAPNSPAAAPTSGANSASTRRLPDFSSVWAPGFDSGATKGSEFD